jgi:16S rRNA (uracil1498-N3)-methyltransferase
LEEKESRHALKVLRLKAGDAVELLDGSGKSFGGFVVGEEAGLLRVQLDANSGRQRMHAVPASLVCAVIKPDAMDWMIQKACELGVAGIFPVLTERSVVKLAEDKWAARTARWQRIAEESCKQCGLTFVPCVAPLARFGDFIRTKQGYGKILIPTLGLKGEPLKKALGEKAPQDVLVMIGPEGDFTEKEVAEAVQAGAEPVSLGPLVMRSETAAVYALSAIRFHYEEI